MKIQVEVGGKMVAAEDASWYKVAPCGCTSGASVVDGQDGGIYMSGEDAFGDMLSAAERRQDAERGYTYELGLRRDVVARMTRCEHEPKWGIPSRPKPDGMEWAATDKSRVLHLAPAAGVETDDHRPSFSMDKSSALCGSEHYRWSARWHRVDGKVECKRCWAAAAKSEVLA